MGVIDKVTAINNIYGKVKGGVKDYKQNTLRTTPMGQANFSESQRDKSLVNPIGVSASLINENLEKKANAFTDVISGAVDKIQDYDKGTWADLQSGKGSTIAKGVAKSVPFVAAQLAPAIGTTLLLRAREKKKAAKAQKDHDGDIDYTEHKIYPYVAGATLGALTLLNSFANKSYTAPLNAIVDQVSTNPSAIAWKMADGTFKKVPGYKLIKSVGKPVMGVIKTTKKDIDDQASEYERREMSKIVDNTAKKVKTVPTRQDTIQNYMGDNYLNLSKTKKHEDFPRFDGGTARQDMEELHKSFSKKAGVINAYTEKNASFKETVVEGVPKAIKEGVFGGGAKAIVTAMTTPVALYAGSRLLDKGFDKLDEMEERRRTRKLEKSASAFSDFSSDVLLGTAKGIATGITAAGLMTAAKKLSKTNAAQKIKAKIFSDDNVTEE